MDDKITRISLIAILLLSVAIVVRIDKIATPAPPIQTPTPTPTPWAKLAVLVEMPPDLGLNIWVDDAKADALRVNEIEGVLDTLIMLNGHMIYARVDPRYSKELVAREIVALLSQPAPPAPTIGDSYW